MKAPFKGYLEVLMKVGLDVVSRSSAQTYQNLETMNVSTSLKGVISVVAPGHGTLGISAAGRSSGRAGALHAFVCPEQVPGSLGHCPQQSA